MTAARVPRVLFLIADTGGGHRAVANAIYAAMQIVAPESALAPAADASDSDFSALPFSPADFIPATWDGKLRPWHGEVRDIIAECGQQALRRTANMYGITVNKRPRFYAGMWHATNTRPTYAALTAITTRMLRQRFSAMLRAMRPDVIVSAHALLTQPTLDLLHTFGVRIPFITVITDLVRFHRSWAQTEVDVCVAPTEVARDLVISFGMPAAKTKMLGMPIHPKFCLPTADPAATRAQLGLERDRFTVLLIGGGEGVGRLADFARAINDAQLPVQLIVVTGRNRALRAEIEADRAQMNIPTAILGFTDAMPDLMHAADVIITKAGSITIAEALACGLPIILTSAIPGQEVGNIDYVVENKVGLFAPTPEALVAAVRTLAAMPATERAAMRERAQAMSHPRAAFDIAKLILSGVPAPTSASVWDRVVITRRRPRQRLGQPRTRGRRIPVPRWQQRTRRARTTVPAPGGRWRRLALLVRRRRRPTALS